MGELATAPLREGEHPGRPSGFSCPDCAGVLWELKAGTTSASAAGWATHGRRRASWWSSGKGWKGRCGWRCGAWRNEPSWPVYATDIDEDALNQARQARYSLRECEGVPADLLGRYFEPNGSTYVFSKELRRWVIFGRHDLIHDAPISRIDLLVCRNALMYFNSEAQAHILARFGFALRDGGYLLLGRAEMLLAHSDLFTPVDLKRRVFRKLPTGTLRERLLVLAEAGNEEAEPGRPGGADPPVGL